MAREIARLYASAEGLGGTKIEIDDRLLAEPTAATGLRPKLPRRAFLERYCDTDSLICPTHFPLPSGGHPSQRATPSAWSTTTRLDEVGPRRPGFVVDTFA
jgi:hypothetical protein